LSSGSDGIRRGCQWVVVLLVAGCVVGACSGAVKSTPPTEAAQREAPPPTVPVEPPGPGAAAEPGPRAAPVPAPTLEPEETADDQLVQYDPWEKFNEKMFEFNIRLDRWVLRPVANVYRKVIPDPFQLMISNGFDNIKFPPRFVNNLLQGKWAGAGREVARFLINSTAGIGGLFDPAKDYWGIRSSREDFGQTLGVWGAEPGPFLVLPFLEPMTVRDGVGRGVDIFLDPLGYFVPFLWEGVSMRVGELINERALNYELFQGVEDTSVDLYSSVRHFYLQRRERQIRE
jgi:phospholipid-binding lipoprotein MlaA